ncbi:MAG TPA: hypothetical protein VJ911_08130 [Cryomorphaceae bacterium]|nr:hypothetical protein [Cryomorphaceae bacterium]
MKKIGLTYISIFIFCSASFSQSQKFNLPKERAHDKAILGFDAEPEKKVYNIQLYADSLIYRSNGSFKTYTYDKLRYIKVNDGSHAGLGAGIGGAIMLLSSLVAVIQVSDDPNMQLRNDAGLRIIGFTAGGAGFGALIGMAFKRQRTYYLHYK